MSSAVSSRLLAAVQKWGTLHPVATFISITASAVAAFVVYRLTISPASKVPGPWYLKLSSLFVRYHDYYGTKRVWIHDLHSRYGPVVLTAPNEASFASASGLKQIYSSNGSGFPKTDLYSLFRMDGHTNLFTALDIKEHRDKRKQLAERYSNSSILKSEILSVITERAEKFVAECTRASSADIYLYCHAYALDCVSAMLYHPHGTRSIEEGEDRDMVEMLSYHDSRKALVLEYYAPILSKLVKMVSPQTLKGGRRIDDHIWESVRKDDHADFSLVSRLTKIENADFNAIASECMDHVGAGIDTTGDTLVFLMWELSQPRNEGRLAKLQAELPAEGAQASLDQLPYLNAVLQEALRLWAPGTLPLPRSVPAGGRSIDGYFFPAGMVVSCQSYTLHRYDDHVFQEPESFLPERWAEDAGQQERNRLFFAFGSGARTCIGKHLAMAEMRALLYAVYSRFRTRPAPDMTASMALSDQFLTSRPKDMLCKLLFEPWQCGSSAST